MVFISDNIANSLSNPVMRSAFITLVLIEKETCSFKKKKNQVLSPPFFYSIHHKTSLKLNYLGHNQTKYPYMCPCICLNMICISSFCCQRTVNFRRPFKPARWVSSGSARPSITSAGDVIDLLLRSDRQHFHLKWSRCEASAHPWTQRVACS